MEIEINRGGRGKKSDSVQLGLRVPRELDAALRKLAEETGTTPGAIVQKLLVEHLKR